MRIINFLYGIICYSFYCVLLILMAILFGGKIILGRYIYFGEFKKNSDDYSYLNTIEILEGVFLYACFFWILSTLFILVKHEPRINRKSIVAGVIGLVCTFIYFISDPFGSWSMLMR
jgi:hypothetical protein